MKLSLREAVRPVEKISKPPSHGVYAVPCKLTGMYDSNVYFDPIRDHLVVAVFYVRTRMYVIQQTMSKIIEICCWH